MIQVETFRLPQAALRCAEQQRLVANGMVLMDASPLYGGVCIYSADGHPTLIGQKNWTRIYHVFAEPEYAHPSLDEEVETVVANASFFPATVDVWRQLYRAVQLLRDYLRGGACRDAEAVGFCILKLWDELP